MVPSRFAGTETGTYSRRRYRRGVSSGSGLMKPAWWLAKRGNKMVQADTIMLDHKTGQLTYSLYRDTKEELRDDCDKIEVKTAYSHSFEADGEYTILDFDYSVELEVEERYEQVVAVVGDAK